MKMKTIQELNSKWGWRLLKVIYIILFLAGVVLIIAGTILSIDNSFKEKINQKIDNTIDELALKGYSENQIIETFDGIKNKGELDYKLNIEDTQKFIIIVLPSVLGLILLFYTIRGSIYYIVLGRFNPEK